MILAKIAIFLLWLAAVFDPIGNMFGIRYLALATALVGLAWLFLISGFKKFDTSYRGVLIIFLSGLLPVYGLALYSFRAGSGEFTDTSYLASGVLIITSLLYCSQSMCAFGVSSFVLTTRLLSLLVIAGYASQVLSIGEWISFFTERNVALVSVREYAGFTLPYIYFLASPLLIFLMSYDYCNFKKESSVVNLLVFTLTAFSFAVTGTRAHMVIALLFIPIYVMLTGNRRAIIKSTILLIILIILAFVVEGSRNLMEAFFSASETSNSMKLSLLNGYGEIFSNPATLLFGQGFNAHEWSPILRNMIAIEEKASKTELTYLELVRVFGIVIATALIGTIFLLLRLTKNLHQNFRWIYPGFSIFLINAAFNPYLFSVNGILPLGLIAAIVYHYTLTNKCRTTITQSLMK